ncbi:MAG: hypothetical protein JNM39_08260 [Bdellovibrionaceae bacterium]|nr:hypothetical protein [Pseudobdellovibrionaceae bacterium]
MDLEVLKKKISSYRTEGGVVRKVSDEILVEILLAWEHWTGPAKGFAGAIGMNRNALPKLIGKAKRLRREGHFPIEDFKEIRVESSSPDLATSIGNPCLGVEIVWDNGKLIRFQQVEQLVDFLKKVS